MTLFNLVTPPCQIIYLLFPLSMLDSIMYTTLLFNFSPITNNNLRDLLVITHQHVTSKVENSVDPDQLASQKPADLNLHCFKI